MPSDSFDKLNENNPQRKALFEASLKDDNIDTARKCIVLSFFNFFVEVQQFVKTVAKEAQKVKDGWIFKKKN